MPILDAALAFALTMLVVATVVTQIVNLGRRLRGVRQANMKRMLKEYFEQELGPVVDRELKRLSDRVGETARAALVDAAGQTAVDEIFPHDEKRMHVSAEELVEQLKRSSVGKKVHAELNDGADRVFDELGKRWDQLGKRFTEEYRARSRVFSTIVAIVLAVVVNIDSWFILDAYLTDRHLAESVTAQLDQITTAANSVITETPGDSAVNFAALQAELEATRDQVAGLAVAGFPIGPEQFPHACFLDDPSQGID